MPYQPPIRWDIAEEHLDEAAFLHQLWEQSLHSPDYALGEIASGPEERMLAHLDGLVVGGGRVAKKLLLPALAADEPGKVFAATFALLSSEDGDFLGDVLQTLETAAAEQRTAVRRAMALAPVSQLGERLKAAAASPGALQQELLLVLAYLRIDSGLRLDALASSEDATVRARALRLAPLLPGRVSTSILEQALEASEPDVRSAALEAGCILSVKGAFAAAQATVKEAGPGFASAALLLGLSGEDSAVAALAPGLVDAERRHASIFALGFSGWVSAIDALLPWLEDPEALESREKGGGRGRALWSAGRPPETGPGHDP
jgi:uncharacterized protein (TIGR02270 family)